jgi:hypothetical protein
MTTKRTISTAVAAAFATVALAAVPGPATAKDSAGLTSFHGTVTSVSTTAKTFRITRAGGTSLTFRVTSATTFQRISGGFSGLAKGRAIEVKARKVDGRWTARKVEPGTAADDHGGGNDDGPNHDIGDDHGGDRG